MKSVFENIFIQAVRNGENPEEVIEELEWNIESHQRIFISLKNKIEKLQEAISKVDIDIDCMMFQKERILNNNL